MSAAMSASTCSRKRSFASRSGGDEQDVQGTRTGRLLHAVPLVLVVRVDRLRADAHPLRGGDLVAHQRQQGADEKGRPETCFAQQPGGDEVDEALSPARLLNQELAARTLDEVPDGFFLSLAESGIPPPRAPLQKIDGSEWVVVHVGVRIAPDTWRSALTPCTLPIARRLLLATARAVG